MNDLISVSEAALELSTLLGLEVSPRRLTALFYCRRLPAAMATVIGGRRLIQKADLPSIANKLKSFTLAGKSQGGNDA